jgi:hypothetical protein
MQAKINIGKDAGKLRAQEIKASQNIFVRLCFLGWRIRESNP